MDRGKFSGKILIFFIYLGNHLFTFSYQRMSRIIKTEITVFQPNVFCTFLNKTTVAVCEGVNLI
jgi:hypothetical protein